MERTWWPKAWLGLIIALYIGIACGYALKTPLWEAPDEPAHYNYIAHLAEKHSLPVLQEGDYPHDYLEKIKAARFPPDMSIAPIRYEAHQPPLYYLVALPFYALGGLWGLAGRVLALRLLSVALGAGTLVMIYAAVREVFPEPQDELLALGAAGFTAAIPMHLAMSAAITNDSLAELLMALVLLASIRMARGKGTNAIALGVLLGAVLLTKTTIYLPSVALVILAALVSPFPQKKAARLLLVTFAVMLAASVWWFIRNAITYGWSDIFGLARHDLVVIGQPRAESLGLAWARRLLVIGFRSFWGQFGWMGIPLDRGMVMALALFSMMLSLGLVLFILRVARQRGLSRWQVAGLGLNLVLVLSVAASFLGYNLKFIQLQGRYLFPAIGALGLGATLGFRELVNRRYEYLLAVVLYVALLVLDLWCLIGVIIPYFQRG